jgi:hypothetical protein
MTIITNKMNATSASYSDLDARTQFVLNRVDFLKSITDVLQNEGHAENVAKITVWRDNNYVALIVRCIMDPNEEIYDHAIWATGNLLGSDDAQIANMTRNAITDEVLQRLISIAGQETLSTTLRRGVNYLIYNLTRRRMPRFFNEAVSSNLLKKAIEAGGKEALTDFLAAVANIVKDEPSAIDPLVLVDTLLKGHRPYGWRRLLKIIGTLAEHDGMIGPTVIDRLMTLFTRELKSKSNSSISRNRIRHEMLWVLSNIMTEIASPVLFTQYHTELKEIVQNIAWDELCGDNDDADMVLGREAVYVLSNFVVAAKDMSTEFKSNIANDFTLESLFSACADHDNHQIAQIGTEIMELLEAFTPILVKPEPEIIDLTGDSDTESEVEDTETEDCYIHPPAVLLARADEAINCECCERPVPSAADLLLGDGRGNESASVRRVVNLLVHLPVGEWAEVPADWTLTVADLTVLQHLGYVIQDGQVGINPEIYSGY